MEDAAFSDLREYASRHRALIGREGRRTRAPQSKNTTLRVRHCAPGRIVDRVEIGPMVSSALLPAASRSPTGRVTPASSLAAIVTNALFVDNPETLGLMSESRHFEPDPPLTKQAEERVGVLSRLKNVWHRYVDSKRQFMSIAERCSNRGWPDRKMEIRNAFRLQELFCDQEMLRFGHSSKPGEHPRIGPTNRSPASRQFRRQPARNGPRLRSALRGDRVQP